MSECNPQRNSAVPASGIPVSEELDQIGQISGTAHTLPQSKILAVLGHTLFATPNFHLRTSQTVEMLPKMPEVRQSLVRN